MGISPLVLEQPVHRDDWEALRKLNDIAKDAFGVDIAADQTCRTMSDIKKVVNENIASVINVSLSKFGVLEILQIVESTQNAGLNLMIDSMIQTRLATGFAAHLAAGVGCFK